MNQNNINDGTSKKSNLLKEANASIFVAKKWNIINDRSNTEQSVGNEIIDNEEV